MALNRTALRTDIAYLSRRPKPVVQPEPIRPASPSTAPPPNPELRSGGFRRTHSHVPAEARTRSPEGPAFKPGPGHNTPSVGRLFRHRILSASGSWGRQPGGAPERRNPRSAHSWPGSLGGLGRPEPHQAPTTRKATGRHRRPHSRKPARRVGQGRRRPCVTWGSFAPPLRRWGHAADGGSSTARPLLCAERCRVRSVLYVARSARSWSSSRIRPADASDAAIWAISVSR
jgi:hypothetical protein